MSEATNRRRKGFTLAEILITLSIIGIVAALTIPQLSKNFQDLVFAKAKENALAKITEATKQMKSNDVLSGYTSNDAFVDEFQKYIKIINRCDSSNLSKCFSAKFKAASGEDLLTSAITSGTGLDSNNLNSNTIGLMLANGTSMLITLRNQAKVGSDCDRIDPLDNTLSTNGCLSFLYDVNGFGSPNKMGKDIGSVNTSIGTCSGLKVGSTCFTTAQAQASLSYADCMTNKGSLGITGCSYDPDKWAGTVSACGGVGKTPTLAQLSALANELLGVSNCGMSTCNGVLDYNKAASMGLPSSGMFILWAAEEGTNTGAYGRQFDSTNSSYGYYARNVGGTAWRTVCIK